MFEVKSDDFHGYASFLIMLIVAAVAVLAVGEACKYILPKGTVFFFTIDKIYFVAAASLILVAGLGKLNLNSLKNLAALFVFVVVLVAVLFYLDKLASSMLWGGAYASALDRVPQRYVDMFYLAMNGLSAILASAGLLLLLVKGLDLLKDTLSGSKQV